MGKPSEIRPIDKVSSQMPPTNCRAEKRLIPDGRHEVEARGCDFNQSTTPRGEKIYVVEDEYFTREGISDLLRDAGWAVEGFSSCETFLQGYHQRPDTCLVLDVHFPGMDGLELLSRIGDMADGPPVVIVSGSSGVSDAVESMKQGASDFIEKPVAREKLLASVQHALARGRRGRRISTSRAASLRQLAGLTTRQRQIVDLVLAGHPSKNIAADLGISQRTVENHRASIMHRTGARSLPALAQLVMCDRCLQVG